MRKLFFWTLKFGLIQGLLTLIAYGIMHIFPQIGSLNFYVGLILGILSSYLWPFKESV